VARRVDPWLNQIRMNQPFRIVVFLISALGLMSPVPAQERNSADNHALELQALVNDAVRQTLERFAGKQVNPDQFAVTLVDLREPRHPARASYRGDAQIYPASVVKLFYLVAVHRWLQDGKLNDTEELRRALHDMIVESYNEATHYVVDLLTDTTSGPELSSAELNEWVDKRNAVNRYFASLGYTNINVNKKPWCEGPYGRETQAIKTFKPSRNILTTDATARLLTEIVTGKAVSAGRSAEMLELLKRDPFAKSSDPDDQAHGFSGGALPPGARLWSKAGWTSEVHHDAAYIELPNGAKFVLVTFTTGHANEREIVPALANLIVAGLSAIK
jgi:beta-lactamase class A